MSVPSPHPELDDLATEMFRLFSRIEYALKAVGLLTKQDGPAEADWPSFADRINAHGLAGAPADVVAAVTFMLTEPPRKQAAEKGKLVWVTGDPGAQSQARLLAVYICRVRNNLFHGGKFAGHWFDPERSKALLEASILLLQHFVSIDGEVQAAFHGA
ncbi:hypothetical protein [Sphingomonas sp. ID0503]|uniref:hypothetical protein n=1 Tax=Sphingomonas sp. ID0503 TaxID=3399691 RepID=UPI003AFADF04